MRGFFAFAIPARDAVGIADAERVSEVAATPAVTSPADAKMAMICTVTACLQVLQSVAVHKDVAVVHYYSCTAAFRGEASITLRYVGGQRHFSSQFIRNLQTPVFFGRCKSQSPEAHLGPAVGSICPLMDQHIGRRDNDRNVTPDRPAMEVFKVGVQPACQV